MNKGFTLVELSIVLVIIGLLIGGILVAQSMIETAKVSAQVRQIQQFDIAVSNFKTKYNGLPGDNRKINGIGNNNGLLDEEDVIPAPFPYVTITGAPPHPEHGNQGVGGYLYNGFNGERANFWPDLYHSGLKIDGMSSAPSNDTSGGVRYNEHIPKAVLGNAGIFPTRLTQIVGSGDNNAYIIADNRGNNAPAISFQAGALTTTEVMALDAKFDNNDQTTGNMVSMQNAMNGLSCVPYLIGNNERNCNLFIKILGQAN